MSKAKKIDYDALIAKHANRSNKGAAGTKKSRVTKTTEKVKTKTYQAESTKTDIEQNPVYDILENPNKTPEERTKSLVEFLQYTDNAEESKERVDSLNKYKEYLNECQKDDARTIIKLTDTEAYNVLKDVIDEMEGGLLDFEKDMAPLVDTVEAIYNLRANNITGDVYREIIEDRKRIEQNKDVVKSKKRETYNLQSKIENLQYSNAEIKGRNKFLFFGGPSNTDKLTIEKNVERIDELQAKLNNLNTEIQELSQPSGAASKYPEFEKEKNILRNLLDISSDENRDRQVKLVNSAEQFIDKSESSMNGVLTHFDLIGSQIGKLSNSNFDTSMKFSIINESCTLAKDANSLKFEQIEAMPEKTSADKLLKEQAIRDFDGFAKVLEKTTHDSGVQNSSLAKDRIRIDAMKNNAETQLEQAKRLKSSGIAGVSGMIATTLQTLSSAAVSESNEAAKSVLSRMEDVTIGITNKSIIKSAIELGQDDDELINALSQMESMGEALKAATEIRRSALDSIKENRESLRQGVEQIKESITDSTKVSGEALSGEDLSSYTSEDVSDTSTDTSE